MSRRYGGFPRYVPVAERRAEAAGKVAQLRKKGRDIKPVEIEGRMIARSFWGKAWCHNLEVYSDYANRLPRGRTYARNGSILDLQIAKGRIDALVSGSRLYEVTIEITPLADARWQTIRSECAGQIDSLVELLAGQLSSGVMEVVSRAGEGLFPTPREIQLGCSCPDWAVMCKHVAATLYGVGARLDHEPKTLFTLRDVDPAEMIEEAIGRGVSTRKEASGRVLETEDLASVFGVDIEFGDGALPAAKPRRPSRKKSRATRSTPTTATKKTARPRRARKSREPDLTGLPASAVRVFEAITANPGLRGPALAAQLGVSKSTIAGGVAKLKKRGLVTFEGAARTGGYFPVSP